MTMKYLSNDQERLSIFRDLIVGGGLVKRCSDIHRRDDLHFFIAFGEKADGRIQKLLKKFNRIIFVMQD